MTENLNLKKPEKRNPNNPDLGEKTLIAVCGVKKLRLNSEASAIVDFRIVKGKLLHGAKSGTPFRKGFECSISKIIGREVKLLGRGYSVCRPMDTFDLFLGKDIAFKRALVNGATPQDPSWNGEESIREEIRKAYYKPRRNYMLKKKGLEPDVPVKEEEPLTPDSQVLQAVAAGVSEEDIPF